MVTSSRARVPDAGQRVSVLLACAWSAAAAADEACAGGAQVTAGDCLFLDCAQRVAEVPAVEPGAAQRRADVVERDDRDGGRERARGLVQLGERDRADVVAL